MKKSSESDGKKLTLRMTTIKNLKALTAQNGIKAGAIPSDSDNPRCC